jgi:hypothetical protein
MSIAKVIKVLLKKGFIQYFLIFFAGINCGCGNLYFEVTDLNPPPQLSPQLKLMTYKVIGKCSDHSLMFSFLLGSGIIFDFDPQLESEVRTAEIKIFLKEDWTYEALYAEYLGNTNTGTQTLTGNYHEVGTQVSFSGLGEGSIVEIFERPYLILKFTHEILTPGLIHKEIPLRVTLNPFGKESQNDYCETHTD